MGNLGHTQRFRLLLRFKKQGCQWGRKHILKNNNKILPKLEKDKNMHV
jgi:hypothetical protein